MPGRTASAGRTGRPGSRTCPRCPAILPLATWKPWPAASQLLAAGLDRRNTAARLGDSGGGATTPRHYADPVPEADRRA